MSTTIDERIVEMRFDNKHFESNVATTMSSLDKLKQGLNLKGATQGLEDIDKAAKKVDLSPIADSADAIKLKFSPLYSFMDQIFRNMANSAEMYGRRIVSAFTVDPIKQGFKEYETQINAVQTILSNTKSKGTTIDDVNGALDELNTYADKTIYNFTEMTKNIGTFTAAGVDLETSVSAIKGIANLAAVSGSTSQQASTAMYQLSQALSSGTVKLMDWNSVVNAGMGGQKFQDALKETARLHGVKIDEMIKEQGSFRETLSEGWLTSKILTETLAKFTGDLNEEQLKSMGYTDEQIKGIIELGRDANDAATRVKTFTQLLDTLKEAAQSGWAQTWEIVFGEFYEARDFFTEVSNTLGGFIGNSAEARNEMLENWKALGGRTDLIESIKNSFQAIVNIIRPISDAFREIFPPMTAEKLAALTSGLRSFTERLQESTEYGSAFYKGVKNTFKGIFSVFKIFVNVIKSVFKAIGPLFGVIGELVVAIFDLVGSFGGFLTKIGDTAEQTDILTTILQGIVKVITFVIRTFTDLIKLLNGRIVSPTLEAFGNVFVSIGDSADGMGEKVKGAFVKMGESLSSLGIFKLFIGLWTIIKSVASAIGNALGPVLSNLFNAIKNADLAGIMDIVNKFISGGVGVALIKFLTNVTNIFKKPMGAMEMFSDNIKDILDEVGNTFKSFQRKLNAEALFTIAKAIAVLVAAIVVLSFVDKDKVADGCSAILLLFVGLSAAMAIVNKGGLGKGIGGMAGVTGIAAAVLILAAAMLIICNLDFNKMLKGIAGIGILLALVGGVALLMAKFGSIPKGNKIAKVGVQMLLLSGVIAILAAVAKSLSNIEKDKLKNGIAGVAALSMLMVAMIALLMAISKINPSGKPFAKMVGQMAAIVYAIGKLADVCIELATVETAQLKSGVTAISVIAGLLTAIMLILTLLTKIPNINTSGIVKMSVSFIAVALAIKLLASAIVPFASMDWEKLGKAGIAFGGVLVFIVTLSLMSKLVKPASIMSVAASVAIVAASLIPLVAALAIFSALNWGAIAKAGTALGGLLGFMAIFSVMSKMLKPMQIVGLGLSVLLIGEALLFLVPALAAFSALNWSAIGKAGVALAGVLGFMAILALVSKLVNPLSILPLAASMLILSLALGALVPALIMMKAVKLKDIGFGLLALAGAIIVLGVAAKLLGGVSVSMLHMATSILIVGAGMTLMGLGLGLLGAGLGAFAAGFTVFVGALVAGVSGLLSVFKTLIEGLGSIAVTLIDSVTSIIVAACQVIVNSAPAIGEAIKAVLRTLINIIIELAPEIADGILAMTASVMKSLVKYADPIVDSLFELIVMILQKLEKYIPNLVQIAFNIIGKLFQGIVDALKNINPTNLIVSIVALVLMTKLMSMLASTVSLIPKALLGVAGISAVLIIFTAAWAVCDKLYDGSAMAVLALGAAIAVMGLISVLMPSLAMASGLAGAAVSGAVGVAAVLGIMAGVIAIAGAIAQIPEAEWLIREGGNLLQEIGVAIGKFIGGIVGGIASGTLSVLPEIGTALSGFMTNMKPFFAVIAEPKTILAIAVGYAVIIGLEKLIKKISSIRKDTLQNSLKKTAQMSLVLIAFSAALAVSALLLKDTDANIAAFATGIVVIGLLSELYKRICKITDKQNKQAFKACLGISAVLVVFAAVWKICDLLGGASLDVIVSMAAAIVVMGLVAELCKRLATIDKKTLGDALISAAAISAVLVMFAAAWAICCAFLKGAENNIAGMAGAVIFAGLLTLLMKPLSQVSQYTAKALVGAAGVSAVLVIFATAWKLCSLIFKGAEANVIALGGAIVVMGLLTLLMKPLSIIGPMAAQALIGAAAVSAVLVIFAGALALVDLIYDPDGTKLLALTGAVLLMGVVTALAAALSLIVPILPMALAGVAGAALLVTEIALLIAAIGALAQIPGLTWLIEEGGNLLKLIGNAIGGFVGGIIGGIAEGITSALPQIGSDLAAFMTNAKPFFDGLANVNADAVNGVSSLAKMVLILTAVDILDGLTSWLTGGSSMVTFGEELAQFGPKFAFFANSIKDIDADTVTASANAALALAEMANKLPGQDGWVQKVMGEHSLATFATELQAFGPAFKAYADSVAGIDPEVVTASANAALALAEMAAKLPAQDGWAQKIMGEHSLATFAQQLNAFAPAFKSYADTIKDIDPAVVTASANAATSLAELSNKLPKSGGLAQWFSGEQDISDFGKKLVKFGEQMKKYSGSLSGVNASQLASTTSSLVKIVDVAKGVSSLNLDNLSNFGTSLGNMGTDGIKKFIAAFENSYEKVVTTGKTMVTKLVSGMQSESSAQATAYEKPAKDAHSAIRSQTWYEAFYNAGSDLVTGFANGISANSYKAEAKAAAMASAAASAAKAALDEHSPSKVGYKIGDFFGVAFVNAVGDYVDKSYDAGYGMADSARSGLSNAISKVNSLINSEMDTQPTIRPVLDLSDVNDGARTISDLFNNGSPLGLMTNIGAVSSMMSKNGQNGTDSEVVSEIKKLRKDIGKIEHSTVSINGITYDDGSNINSAIETIVRAAKVERRR